MSSAFDIGRSGMDLSNTWLSVIANNIANANTINPAGQAPFREKFLVAQAVPGASGPAGGGGDGVVAAALVADNSIAAVIQDPGNPLADAQGNVTRPVVDLGAQMTDMMMAQRSFQANESTIENARDMYTAALRIGK